MISVFQTVLTAIGCMIAQQPLPACVPNALANISEPHVEHRIPMKTGHAVDVYLTADSAFVWDIKTGTVLYDRNADKERPIASLNKLVSTVSAHALVSADTIITIPPQVKKAQQKGVGIKLIPGEHAYARDLFSASLIPSANDAMVSLAIHAKGSEQAFTEYANSYAQAHGLRHTLLANSTGLEEGVQYSTARDVSKMLMLAYGDSLLRPFLSQQKGVLISLEGKTHEYKTTDELLGTYLPILAGKTGYTHSAKQNLAIITQGKKGQLIGAVILGSDDRFQDMKTVVEWVYRNITWP